MGRDIIHIKKNIYIFINFNEIMINIIYFKKL